MGDGGCMISVCISRPRRHRPRATGKECHINTIISFAIQRRSAEEEEEKEEEEEEEEETAP